MKITAGIGSADAYIPCVQAGADELFCGYVPADWMEKYGIFLPLNRREVLYYPVQIGSRSELQILNSMKEIYGVPVSITLNSLYYTPEQYPILADYIEQCVTDGFSSFIVADMALLVYLHEQGIDRQIQLHISGELSEINHLTIAQCRKLGADRVIFHRKTTLADMKTCVNTQPELEYEAFVLNEMCHFHGAFCSSLHCDELPHACLIPYRLGGVHSSLVCEENTSDAPVRSCVGQSGCGLCALWRMREAGISYGKLVSRGNFLEDTVRDIRAFRTALDILDDSADEVSFQKQLKRQLFSDECSGTCYYPVNQVQ